MSGLRRLIEVTRGELSEAASALRSEEKVTTLYSWKSPFGFELEIRWQPYPPQRGLWSVNRKKPYVMLIENLTRQQPEAKDGPLKRLLVDLITDAFTGRPGAAKLTPAAAKLFPPAKDDYGKWAGRLDKRPPGTWYDV